MIDLKSVKDLKVEDLNEKIKKISSEVQSEVKNNIYDGDKTKILKLVHNLKLMCEILKINLNLLEKELDSISIQLNEVTDKLLKEENEK